MQFNIYTHAHTHKQTEKETYVKHEVIRKAHLPIRKGSIRLNRSNTIIGCHALVLGQVVAASARGNLPSFLERLLMRLMASALLKELKTLATEV